MSRRKKKQGQKTVVVDVTSVGPLTVGPSLPVRGWGEDGHRVEVGGQAAQISVSRGGKAMFSVRILENGDLILTNYGSNYTMPADRNLRLTNTVPWEE